MFVLKKESVWYRGYTIASLKKKNSLLREILTYLTLATKVASRFQLIVDNRFKK